ncbi:MAG: glycoside hydrolase family 75 protein [Bacteroidota bacterium]|nr:glycoside hydrolase family 75 protein [Bacteroidota bacterium]
MISLIFFLSRGIGLLTALLSACSAAQQSEPEAMDCSRSEIMQVDSIPVWKVQDEKIFVYQSGMTVDADGSPRAYHPDDIGLDYLRHANHSGEWEGIVHVDGKPVIQGPKDPAPGYYVSQTALEDKTKNIPDPARYVNAEVIPYFVLPPSVIKTAEAELGDIAVVWNRTTDRYAYAIFADIGPEGLLGEGSIALAASLGMDANPKHGGADSNIVYIVFPKSGNNGPLTEKEIRKKGEKLLENAGGIARLCKCLD